MAYELNSLFAFLLRIKDPRRSKGKIYPLATLLVLIFQARLGGEDKPSGITEWVANRVDELVEMKILAKEKAPCHMTFRRLIQIIVTPEELESQIRQFHQSQLPKEAETLYSMEGKTVRGMIPSGETRGTHLLSVFTPEQGLVMAEAKVDQKENEIVVAPTLLKEVNLQGAIVLGDAMHTQRGMSE